MSPLVLTIPQTAEALQMSEGWVEKKIRSKEIRSIHLGRAVRVRVCDIEDYLRTIAGGTPSLNAVPPGTTGSQLIEKRVGMAQSGSEF